jgi:exopolysaccharide biosynthesis polyprenyl glycosylphosphotransferase
MISYRHRGFVSLHNIVCGAAALALLPAFAVLLPWIPGLRLEDDVRLAPYAMAVLVGMIWAQRGLFAVTLDLHRLSRNEAARLAVKQTCVVAICIFILMFGIKDRGISRLFLVIYLVLLWAMLTFLHLRLPALLARWLFSAREMTPVLLIGRGENAHVLDAWLERRLHLGLSPVGLLLNLAPSADFKSRVPYLGTWGELSVHLVNYQVAQVILLGWVDDAAAVEQMVQQCEAAGCRFLIHNDYGSRFARRFLPMEEGGHDFLAVQSEPLEDPLNQGLKRCVDLAIALPVVVLVLPGACAAVWFLQRWHSPGPLFFTFPRGGWKQGAFNMIKFRSMHNSDHDVSRQAQNGDLRIYSGGNWLRRTSMDELPQFWNVLRGEMSVVGPRPHLPKHDNDFSRLARGYRIRSLVKPGITGLAQIKGFRGEITNVDKLQNRLYWDLYYARNWSLLMDLKIVAQTAWQVFFPPKSAY